MPKPRTSRTRIREGSPHPRGATWDGEGVNFALFSQHSDKVELCLFDERGRHELQRIVMRERTDDQTADDDQTAATNVLQLHRKDR